MKINHCSVGFERQYRVRVFLPVALILTACDQDWLRSLAFFVRLKSLYKNNTVYDYTLRSLSSMIKVSPSTLIFHLKVLARHGLIRYTGEKNITFLGAKALLTLVSGSTQKLTNVSVDHRNQNTILRGKILQINLNQQNHNIRKSETILSPGNLMVAKTNERISNYEGISCQGFGRKLHCSKSTGQRERLLLTILGVIQCDRVIEILAKGIRLAEFQALKRAGVFPPWAKNIDGTVFIDRPHRVRYLDTK